MSKYTPGPWEVSSENPCRVLPTKEVNERQGDDVCICDTGADFYQPDNEGMCEANARLIASAPDLLEACKALLKFNEELCRDFNVSIHYPSAEKAGQVIAKAEGR